MKKITIVFAIAVATVLTSCGGKGTSTETVDSTSVVVDTLLIDSTSVVLDSTVAGVKVEEVK